MNSNVNNSQIYRAFVEGSLCRRIIDMATNMQTNFSGEEKPYHRGYYTGAFDMFHYGHLLGIQKALDYCDQLIVAVSTDEVIKDYKHRDPIIPFEQRLAIVSAIKGVTLAIPQYDLYDKMGPASELGCDVIFSSNEYLRSTYQGKEMTPKQQAGVERWERFEEQAKEEGIDVLYLPRTEGVSSTDIKQKIVEQFGDKLAPKQPEEEDITLEPTKDENPAEAFLENQDVLLENHSPETYNFSDLNLTIPPITPEQ